MYKVEKVIKKQKSCFKTKGNARTNKWVYTGYEYGNLKMAFNGQSNEQFWKSLPVLDRIFVGAIKI